MPSFTSPTIMPVNMLAPTTPPIVAVVCRMGARTTWKPTPTTSPPPCPAHPFVVSSTVPPVWPTTWASPTMANPPDPDALGSAKAARNVRGVSNCCGGDKRGRNTAVGMFRFQGETCLQQFTTWLDYLAEETGRPLTVLAHNFQGYDSYPLVEEYHRQKRMLEQTRNGAKILQLKVGDIRFIDSLSFFQMPLSAFPKTFGLTELKKGYFAHLFNTRANQHYVGPLPPKDLLARQHERPGPPGFQTLVR